MEKFKICPSCNSKNEPTLLECLYCEADLTRVKISDDEAVITEEAEAPKPSVPLVRMCGCGKKNPPNARKCGNCGEDISDITPVPEAGETEFVLSSTDGKYAYKMTASEVIIGRENTMGEYLSDKSYVSRAHAKLASENGKLYIENLSTTNFTYINNRKIIGKEKLSDGDEIGLGGKSLNGSRQSDAAYFIVRIK